MSSSYGRKRENDHGANSNVCDYTSLEAPVLESWIKDSSAERVLVHEELLRPETDVDCAECKYDAPKPGMEEGEPAGQD
jgi:hypothetical protein